MSEFISQIPEMLSGKELEEALRVLPKYNKAIKETAVQDRLLALETIYRLYIPFQMSLEVYSKIYLSIIRGLKEKGSQEAVKQRNQNYNIIRQKSHRGIITGADSFTIIGASGIGKSTAIQRAVSVATNNRLIVEERTERKIIPCLQVQCPFDCSVKSLLFDILLNIDEIIGTNYFERAQRARASIDILIGSVSTVLLNHACLLVVDEIQNTVNHRAGKSLIGILTQLINNSGIAICMVGIPESEVFFEQTDYLARRAIGLKFERLEYGEEFIRFCQTMYGYMYTKTSEVFSDEISLWFYEHSGGALAIVVGLFHDAQEMTILDGSDHLSIAALDTAYRKRYSLISKNKKVIRTGTKNKKEDDISKITKDSIIKNDMLYSQIAINAREMNKDIVEVLKTRFKVMEVAI